MPDPLDIFLSGGAGIRKSFLANLIPECLKKKTLKYAGQNCDYHPSAVVTASTGKAAININASTLHSAFSGPVGEVLTKENLAMKDCTNFKWSTNILRYC